MAMHTDADLQQQLQETVLRHRREGGPLVVGRSVPTTQEKARKIMGKNFFGIEEAVRFFNASPTENERLSVVEWTEQELQEHKDTHVLVAAFPFSMLDIRGCVDRNLFYPHENAWYNNEAFANEKGETGWHLVRKTPVENSTSKTWDEQQALLSQDEETPATRIMIYTIIGHFLVTGERLFGNIYVRCSDVVSDDYRVLVGYFDDADAYGLDVVLRWDGSRYDNFGVSAAQKSI